MQCLQFVKANNPVKFSQNTIQVVHNIVSTVIDVAGIKTYTHTVASNRIDNRFQFFELSADFAALSGHGFQQHRHGISRLQCLA